MILNKEKLTEILSDLNIDAKCVNVLCHRHFAFYDLVLGSKTKIKKLENSLRELSLKLHTKGIPIVEIIPLYGIIRLHVTIANSELITLDSLLSKNINNNYGLPFVLGEGDDGKIIITDFTAHPHTLIAGTTGSGKSVLLHSLIANAKFLKDNNIRNIELYLIDPKRVEFGIYKNKMSNIIKHITYDSNGAISLLKFLVQKMEARYSAMEHIGIQNVNEKMGMFPYIMLIIDEVADLMTQDSKKEFETLIVRLAQKSRAAGIHIVLSTQRPSREVLTGLIKSNFPTRIACKVSSRINSQVILDSAGAENLLGKGDSIINSEIFKMKRFQAGFTDPKKLFKRI